MPVLIANIPCVICVICAAVLAGMGNSAWVWSWFLLMGLMLGHTASKGD